MTNLFLESGRALRWVGKVLGEFLRVRPWTTLAIITANVINRFCRMLSFFLPLKVILLAGSDGVPRYFQFFIDPNDKEFWIILLSSCAVGFYLMTLLLDALIKSLSDSGGTDVLQGANEIAVASRHRDEVRGYFSRFSGIAANLLVIVLGYTVLGLMNPILVAVLLALVVAQYLFTTLIVRYGDRLNPGRLFRAIKFKLHSYLDVLSSINFLTGFFVLLTPYLLGGEGNLLAAILSILLMRQTSGAFKGVATATTDLWNKRLEVDPMVFKHRQQSRKEKPVTINLRHAFAIGERAREAEEKINLQDDRIVGVLKSFWEDSSVKGTYTFHLERGGRHWLQRVFPKSQLHLLENEQFLFEKFSREVLYAPSEVARFTVGPFECQVVDYGVGESVSQEEWVSYIPHLMKHYWSIGVPESLLDAYVSSRKTLEGRLTHDYIKRLEVALDTPEIQAVYSKLLEMLPVIKECISKVPLYIYNPDVRKDNTVIGNEGEIKVLSWGSWSIEHIGVSVPRILSQNDIEEILAEVRSVRGLASDQLTLHHVELVSNCRSFEKEIAKANYLKAITIARDIVDNPVLVWSEHEKY